MSQRLENDNEGRSPIAHSPSLFGSSSHPSRAALWPERSVGICDKLGMRFPIIQAPMAGGPSTPALVSAVTKAGGLGSIAAGYLSGEKLGALLSEVEALGCSGFSVNLMVPPRESQRMPSARVVEKLNHARVTLGLSPVHSFKEAGVLFDEQLEVVLQHKIRTVSFVFGKPDSNVMGRLRDGKCITIGTATSVREAQELEQCGIHVVVAQGAEAGGHRGGFPTSTHQPIGTLSLVPQIVDKVTLPTVAAGGIMDGRSIAAALCLGAAGVQLGTAFMGTSEAALSAPWLASLRAATDESTVLTNAFTGKWARGIRNAFIDDLAPLREEVASYPLQHYCTAELREAAKKQGNDQYMSLWAGQSAPLIREMGAAQLIEKLVEETAQTLSRISRSS